MLACFMLIYDRFADFYFDVPFVDCYRPNSEYEVRGEWCRCDLPRRKRSHEAPDFWAFS
jgi:hypothetical protein